MKFFFFFGDFKKKFLKLHFVCLLFKKLLFLKCEAPTSKYFVLKKKDFRKSIRISFSFQG
jgi:hypothetical protein